MGTLDRTSDVRVWRRWFVKKKRILYLRKRKEKFILADKDGIHKIIKKNKNYLIKSKLISS